MIEAVIEQRRKDLGGFEVGRVLPWAKRRMVGPWVFFDHFGPAEFAAGVGREIDVRPHPHIGLSTVTYLFEGEIMHRDSVGTVQPIRAGAVNWMTAGRGITHSERFERARLQGDRLHGIQSWVALPEADEETPPAFSHHPMEDLPLFEERGLVARLVAGQAFGRDPRCGPIPPCSTSTGRWRRARWPACRRTIPNAPPMSPRARWRWTGGASRRGGCWCSAAAIRSPSVQRRTPR